jgi:hypothetical protein
MPGVAASIHDGQMVALEMGCRDVADLMRSAAGDVVVQ